MERKIAGGHKVIRDTLLSDFITQFENLDVVVLESHNRVSKEPADDLFYLNQIVFIKSFLVSSCSILEAFIQDLASEYVEEIQRRMNSAKLPFNFVAWIAEHDKAKLEYKPFRGLKVKKDVSELISPNYWKTMKAFERIGVDLSLSDTNKFKDKITTVIEKRNKIVHHNDDAMDMSFSDVSDVITQFKDYSVCLFNAVCSDPYLAV